MAIDYPSKFPAEARHRIWLAAQEAESAVGKLEYESVLDSFSASPFDDAVLKENRLTGIQIIVTHVAIALASELRILLKAPTQWTSNEARRFCQAFVESYTLDLFKSSPELKYDVNARRITVLQDLHERVALTLEECPTWVALEREMDGLPNNTEAIGGDTGTSVNVPNLFRRAANGGGWEIRFGGEYKNGVRHLEGFELIKRLLEQPGIRMSAVVLTGRETVVRVAAQGGGYRTEEPALSRGEPAVDEKYRKELISRLNEIPHEIARYPPADPAVGALKSEAGQIRVLLRTSSGLRGSRSLGSELEKARKAATRRYKTALECLQTEHSALYEHLKLTVTSGNQFVYSPKSDERWHTIRPSESK